MAANPFGGLGPSSSGSGFGGLTTPTYKPPKPKAKKKKSINKAAILAMLRSNIPEEQKAIALASAGFTPRQTATTLAAFKSQGHQSFGDKLKGVGKGALGGATWAMDKLMRPSWAVTASVNEAWDIRDKARKGNAPGLGEIKDIGEAAKRGFTGKERQGFGEVLGEHGVLKGHRKIRGATGFGLDIVTDPLMLLSLGASVPSGGGATAGYMAAKAGARSVTPKLLKKAAEEAGQKALKGATDEVTEELLKAGGKKFASRHALLQLNKANRSRPIMGLTHEEAIAAKSEEAIATSLAHKEALEFDYRKIYLKYGTRKHHIKVPLTPALARPGQRISRAGIPVISQLSDRLGKGFIPDWKNPIVRSGQVARQHVAEQNAVMQRQLIGKILNGVDETMDVDHFLQGLHHMEQPLKTAKGNAWKAVVPIKTGGFRLNERYISLLKKRGMLDASQEDAIRRYFEATESMYKFDRAAGVAVENFGEHGRMYVPHILLKDGETAIPTISQRGLLTEAGFQKGRTGALSILQIKELVKSGALPTNIETNPFRLLAHRSRAGAERQADMALINTLKASIGVPTRLVNEKSVALGVKRTEAALAKHDAAIRAAAHAEGDYDKAVQKIKNELLNAQKVAEKGYAATTTKLRTGAKATAVKKLEGQIAKLRKEVPADKVVSGRVSVQTTAKGAAKQFNLKNKGDELGHILIVKKGKGWEVQGLVVNPRHYRQGIATRLWDEAKKAHPDLKHAPVKMRTADGTPFVSTMIKRDRLKALEAQLRKVKAAKVTTPQMAKNQIKMVKLRKQLDDALKAIDNPRTNAHKLAVSEPLLAHNTAKDALKEAKVELKAANAQYKKAVRGKANPAMKPHLQVDSRATDKYGHSFAFPQDAADSFLRLERIVSGNDSTVDNFVHGFAKWQGAWKVLVTIVNPGYRIRNTMTDMWNMWLSGIGPAALGKYGTRAARTMKSAADGDPAAFGWVQEAADHGILAGLFAGDIARVEKYFKYGGNTSRALRKNHQYIALTTKVMQDFNKSAENWGRLTHYMWRRQALGESAGEAAMRVKLAHFDYSDLTPFEQKLRDSIFPFYTWTRKNIPYQVKKIFQEPGRYSAFPKLAQESTYASGQESGVPVPEFVETGMGFPIGKGKYCMPQFGVSDLIPFQGKGEAFDRVAAMLSPAIKTPIELYQNKSFFTKQPIADERHPRAPVTPFGAKLLSLIPGSNVGPTSRQGIEGPGANPYYTYLLGQIPASRLAGITGPGSITAKRTGNAALTSWIGGQSVVTSDPEQQAYYASLEIQDQVDKMLQGLRDAGLSPTKKRGKSEIQKLIEQIAGGNYGG